MDESTEVMLPQFEAPLSLEHLSATICAELAAGLAEPADVRAKYNISDQQWDTLRHSPVFRSMLKDAVEKLAGDNNAGRRITIKSEIALEDTIPTVYNLVRSPDTPSAVRIDGVKVLAMLANRGKGVDGGAAGAGFAVNIHINTDKSRGSGVVIEGESSPSPD
jgi:hypothetical protein